MNTILKCQLLTHVTQECGKTYNVNLENLKGGKKHLRLSDYTVYTDGSKKKEGTGGGFVVYHIIQQNHTHIQLQDGRPCNSIPS